MKLLSLLAALGLLAAACGPQPADPTPTAVYPTALPPSPTVNPVAPLSEGPSVRDPGIGGQGVSNPTQAALAAEGEPEVALPTLTPQATDAELPLMFSAPDGLVLYATLYGAAVRPAPGVLLIHQEGQDRTSWGSLPARLQGEGYSVLAIDLRGHGDTGGAVDWSLAPGDVQAVLEQFSQLPGIRPGQIAVVGAGTGANLGLNACAALPGCGAAVLLSPGLDYHGITAAQGIAALGTRPTLIVSGENDRNNPADSVTLSTMAAGDHDLILIPATAHGAGLFAADPTLEKALTDWLIEHIAF